MESKAENLWKNNWAQVAVKIFWPGGEMKTIKTNYETNKWFLRNQRNVPILVAAERIGGCVCLTTVTASPI